MKWQFYPLREWNWFLIALGILAPVALALIKHDWPSPGMVVVGIAFSSLGILVYPAGERMMKRGTIRRLSPDSLHSGRGCCIFFILIGIAALIDDFTSEKPVEFRYYVGAGTLIGVCSALLWLVRNGYPPKSN